MAGSPTFIFDLSIEVFLFREDFIVLLQNLAGALLDEPPVTLDIGVRCVSRGDGESDHVLTFQRGGDHVQLTGTVEAG